MSLLMNRSKLDLGDTLPLEGHMDPPERMSWPIAVVAIFGLSLSLWYGIGLTISMIFS